MTVALKREDLQRIYRRLYRHYGPQHWWPGESVFEIMIGAVLTQNAAWSNVERAIANLRAAGWLTLDALLAADEGELAEALRPSGYFNIKTRRLLNLCRHLQAAGGEAAWAACDTAALRQTLLSVNGVGPETADDILLYAFERPVFVIDAYTRRLLRRQGLARGDEPYEALRAAFERTLGPDVRLFNEYHGLIVQHAKQACGAKPRCSDCCLAAECSTNGEVS